MADEKSPAFLALQAKLAASRATNGNNIKSNSPALKSTSMKYYKSDNPSFGCLITVAGVPDVRVKFKNGLYKTDDKKIQDYLVNQHMRRGHMREITQQEYEGTPIVQTEPELTSQANVVTGMSSSAQIPQ